MISEANNTNELGNDRETDAFFAKLCVLSNDRERIQEQINKISKAADQIDKYIEMLRGTGLTYTADSMVRNTAEIKRCQKVIQASFTP